MNREKLNLSIQIVKENISILENQEPKDEEHYLQLEHEKIVLNALEKQMPKTVTHEATLYKCCTCPICKNVVDKFEKWGENTVRIKYKYCHFCGQKLDWDDHSTEKGETQRQIQTAKTMIEKMVSCYDKTEKGGGE